jgi:hypothetical protein
MGESSEGIAANGSEINELGSRKEHDVSINA